LRAARYAVVVWAAGEFDFPHAELAIQTLCELVRDLNHTSRAAALPLSGNQADLSFNQTCTWLTGYPVRTAFNQGSPHYDPLLYDGRRLLETGETDLLIWVSSLDPDAVSPETDLPTIVLGHPRMGFKRSPEVFIPLGVPGVDHAGHLYRTDGVVALPLRQLRQPALPSAADVLNQINERLS
jgi:formylmethanofuran dehydrogenase subunit B